MNELQLKRLSTPWPISNARRHSAVAAELVERHIAKFDHNVSRWVDRHLQKNGEGWLLNEQEQLIVCFRNALPSAHAKWIELETRPMRGNGQPIVRRMLRHNAIEAWTHMQKTGWVRCQPRW